MSKDWTGNFKSVAGWLGASNHCESEREEHDYYATEPRATELLLEIENFSTNIWECACGEGHIGKVLEQHGYNVKATDLIDRGYGMGGVDFLTQTEQFDGDIITNPPYKYAQQFVEKALELVPEGRKVAMFLKVQFLEGKGRRKMFDTAPPLGYGYLLHACIVEKTVCSVTVIWLRMLGISGKKDIKVKRCSGGLTNL